MQNFPHLAFNFWFPRQPIVSRFNMETTLYTRSERRHRIFSLRELQEPPPPHTHIILKHVLVHVQSTLLVLGMKTDVTIQVVNRKTELHVSANASQNFIEIYTPLPA